MELVVVGVAGGFAALNGRNDGGTLLAAGVTRTNHRPLYLAVLAAMAVGLAPLLLGTRVATTLVEGIVPIGGRRDLLVVVVASTILVVAVTTRFGLSTSVGLAVVGGLVGVGVGADLPVNRAEVVKIVILGTASPLVAAFGGRLIALALTEIPAFVRIRRSTNGVRWWTYIALCLAYGANDGQKALAVFALSLGASLSEPSDLVPLALVTAVIFLGGMVMGTGRVAAKVGRGLARSNPIEIATANVVAAAVVIGGAGLGTPLSMTQAITGATVGVASRPSWRRVRWPVLGHLAMAWVMTMPMAAAVAAILAGIAA